MVTIRQFVKAHRKEIDRVILHELMTIDFPHNDEERRRWVFKNADLYSLARSKGVTI